MTSQANDNIFKKMLINGFIFKMSEFLISILIIITLIIVGYKDDIQRNPYYLHSVGRYPDFEIKVNTDGPD
ncbi:hypothetical protein Loa_01416 [Legionella oakridgensis ATCC 33761 = DSM 21215]|uniref:Uncharacterized protein n=2 Tax=Legionella oakridgensis TaxID=29423 RepID=W0BEX0_9GAMM|nr:hypothetical protein Loa_01416 [Legionella oakridgensis ATCC 33761 = DSM 21215]KTD39725.1 hypothetical protein Loak_0907 [Legionella oakridgensis]